jgi:hypothetical protein
MVFAEVNLVMHELSHISHMSFHLLPPPPPTFFGAKLSQLWVQHKVGFVYFEWRKKTQPDNF